jgi:uncharacterized protein
MVSQEMADKQSAPAPRLYVDAMLGTLAKWLRLAGYDAEFWREGSDDELIAAARQQDRLILTKDHGLAGRRGVQALLLEADELEAQIDEARGALQQSGAVPEPFTRCAECNGLLADLPHADAQGLVPAYVWHTQPGFRRCNRCGRVYWKGTHWPSVQDRLAGSAESEEDEGF